MRNDIVDFRFYFSIQKMRKWRKNGDYSNKMGKIPFNFFV